MTESPRAPGLRALASADRPRWARLRLALASELGIGRAPIAPGTFGSLPALPLVWVLWTLGGTPAVAAALAVVTAVGIWAADGAAAVLGRTDPGEVVIDEAAGQILTMLWVSPGLAHLVLGFFLFRLFDILKPFPARRAESLPGGWGIVADDLFAGVYANLGLQAACRLWPGILGAP